MSDKFKELQHKCGLSNQGVARLFNVKTDTVKNWKYGRTKVPEGVMSQMGQLKRAIDIIFGDKDI